MTIILLCIVLLSFFSDTQTYASEKSLIHNPQPMSHELITYGTFKETIPLPESPQKISRERKYRCCPNPYKQWSCKERCDSAVCCTAFTTGSLGLRELIALLFGCFNRLPRRDFNNCSTAHQFMWCTVEQWFPIEHTSDSILCCAHALCDASTIITTGSALYTCCILSPCITKDGCICER